MRERVAREIESGPGRTELELTRAIFGPELLYSRVQPQCRGLLEAGTVRREGRGGVGDPYRYFPAADSRPVAPRSSDS